MNERTLQALEYDKIIYQLTKEAATSLGEELISALKPSTNIEKVIEMQLETDEAMSILRLNKEVPLGGIFDIRASIKRSKIGGILTIEECLNVASTIYGGRQVKYFIEKIEEELPILSSLVEQITSLRELEQQIKRCIDDKGNMLDQATPKLRSLRSSIRTTEKKVREKLIQYTRTKTEQLSESIITIRNDRYVLPVKHEHQHSIGGIVHDQSASGQTVFMEPRAVVQLNNDLQHLYIQEQQEIERILRTLSLAIAESDFELSNNISVLANIDFINARAKLGQKMNASMPTMNDKGIINMQQARHPLIPIDEVVANDIKIGEDYTTIVITGPNTGGKTVTLKLIGLCTLMAQSGLQVPALDGCQMAVFDRVFADIGDEQSIEQNLSTFSSHMSNIVNIVDQVNDKTLVLFDELGAGTDPQEGAALAMSILDEVVGREARIVATTHYPELKAYGYNRKNVINASVEFDINTLQPTYRLLLGVPGRSNAFDISKRLGLDIKIIERAKNHIGIDSKSVESMIGSLEASTRRADQSYKQAHKLLLESEQLYDDLQHAWSNFLDQREQLYKIAEEKAEKSLQKARQKAEMIVSDMRKMQTESFKEHEWIAARKTLEKAQPHLTSEEADKTKEPEAKTELQPGDDIKLLTVNQAGTVLEKINDNEYMVQVGMMRVTVDRSNLELMTSKKQEEQTPVATIRGSSHHVKNELDLRGERYEDAIQRLEKYIDDALLAGHAKVSIIHGKGTGALRKGVQNFAHDHPSISSYRNEKANEGGSGVTIIELG